MKFLLLALFIALFSANAFSQEGDGVRSIVAPDPLFPAEAKDPMYGDDVRVTMTVDKKGIVKDVKVMGPLVPCANLDDPVAKSIGKAAGDAAKGTTFEPILRDGKPKEMEITIAYPLRPKPLAVPDKKPIAAGVLNGRALLLPRPQYPGAALAIRISGVAVVNVLIGEDGNMLSVGPGGGHPILVKEAMETACRARFAPTILEGNPVRIHGTIKYTFTLPLRSPR